VREPNKWKRAITVHLREQKCRARELMAMHTGWAKWKHWHKRQQAVIFHGREKPRIFSYVDNKQKIPPVAEKQPNWHSRTRISFFSTRYSQVIYICKRILIALCFPWNELHDSSIDSLALKINECVWIIKSLFNYVSSIYSFEINIKFSTLTQF